MIDEIRGRELLDGVRSETPSDVDALAEMLSALSQFAAAHGDRIASIDLNPVLVLPRGQGVAPLDALIALKPELSS